MSRAEDRTEIADDYGENHKYYVQQHPAGQGFRLLVRIVRIAGGALGRTWGSFSASEIGDKVGEIAEEVGGGLDGEGLAVAVEKMAGQILEEGGESFLKEILAFTSRDGAPLNFDSAYLGNYGELFAALAFVLKVNFGPFFNRILGRFTGGGVQGLLHSLTQKLQTLEKHRDNSD